MILRSAFLKLQKLGNQNSFIAMQKCYSSSDLTFNLTDLEKTVVSSRFDPLKYQSKIVLNMLVVDASFRYAEFSKGAAQV
jgi:hypothetical protein